MKTFTASRLVTGNRIFPNRIVIDDKSVTVNIPGLFSGKEQTIPFTRISSVKVECPFVGYSTIIIATTGEGEINAHGFLKSEVEEMKEMILAKIS
ncbi:MAG: PH domain-containing protein [Bacteroidota bacterium]